MVIRNLAISWALFILCVILGAILIVAFTPEVNAAELSAANPAQSDQIPVPPVPTPPPNESCTQAIVRDELRQLFALMQRQAGEADLPDTRVQARPGKTWKRGNYPLFN